MAASGSTRSRCRSTVEDFRIFEADGATPFVGFSRLYVNAQLSSVFRRAPVIKEIALDSLRLHVVRTKATAEAWADVGAAYNFSDIVARLAAMAEVAGASRAARQRRAAALLAQQHPRRRCGASPSTIRPTGGHHEMTDLAVGVPFVSTLPVYVDSFVEPGLQRGIDGTPFAIDGTHQAVQGFAGDACSSCGCTRST